MKKTTNGLIKGHDDKTRCWWPGEDELYLAYHDTEWGMPLTNDIRLFEKLSLEGFQAGLSWITILRKRENFRAAFDGFDFEKVSRYSADKIEHLVQNTGIIRHRGKIEATIKNAQKISDIVDEYGSFAAYFWRFEPADMDRPNIYNYETLSQITMSVQSEAMSKDLKKRGFKFVGPTTIYAHMQSAGLVNDHIEGCFCRPIIDTARDNFERP